MKEEYHKDEEDLQEFEENPVSKWMDNTKIKSIVGVFIILLLLVGVYIGINFFEKAKDEKKLNVNTLESSIQIGADTYKEFVDELSYYGIKKPSKTFVYNLKIPEKEREKIDPMYNDPYIGFEENQNLQASLFDINGDKLFVLYDTDTDMIEEMTEWSNKDSDISLKIYQIRGEKALLTKQTLEETDENVVETNKKKIMKLNNSLSELFNQLQQNNPIYSTN